MSLPTMLQTQVEGLVKIYYNQTYQPPYVFFQFESASKARAAFLSVERECAWQNEQRPLNLLPSRFVPENAKEGTAHGFLPHPAPKWGAPITSLPVLIQEVEGAMRYGSLTKSSLAVPVVEITWVDLVDPSAEGETTD